MIITKIFRFEAAHRLLDYNGPCANLHGHTYELHVSVSGDVGANGFVMDFKEVKAVVKERVIAKLDHSFINDTIKQSTAENILLWIWSQLETKLPLYELKLYETADSYAIYRGPHS